MDDRLDFEFEDPLPAPHANTTNSHKAIGLDDLLSDYFKEKGKEVEKKKKRIKSKAHNDSDEEDRGKVALLSKKINECHKQMYDMCSEEEVSSWGLCIFGDKKEPVNQISTPRNCLVLRSFHNGDLNALVDIKEAEVDTFLESFLVNGWLSTAVRASRYVEESICQWVFYLMLYSSKVEVMVSACKFWCAVCSSEKEHRITTEWVPTYSALKDALDAYGYVFDYKPAGIANSSSNSRGPPRNIRSWLKFVTECFRDTSKRFSWSIQEAESTIEILVSLSLERSLQNSLPLLRSALQSLVDYFEEDTWNDSLQKIAMNLARRIPGDVNCLRVVEFLSGVSSRASKLRSAVSYHFLLLFLKLETNNEEDILLSLTSINLKDKNCDFFKMHIYLHLANCWISSNPNLQSNKVLHEMFGLLLRNCSCHIASTDFRPYASKVRTKATYLLHGYSYGH